MHITPSILQDFKCGDITPFYESAYPSLLLYAERLLGRDMAYMGEDCVSDAIFHAYQQRESFSTPPELKAYLYTCLHNEVVSLCRKAARHKRYLSFQPAAQTDVIDSVVLQETLDRLHKLIESLPPRLRDIYVMTYEEGMRRHEIAARLGVSEATVKRDRQKLKDILHAAFKDDIIARFIIAVVLDIYI